MVEEIMSKMIEVEIPESISPRDNEKMSSPFVMIMEVLTRIGFLKDNTIYQTAHILKKKGKYYICHFKQLFALDGLNSSYDDADEKRLHKIAALLDKWGMVKVKDRKIVEEVENNEENNVFVHIVPVEKIKSGEVKRIKKYNL